MKKFVLILILLSTSSISQTLFLEENFNFTGNLTDNGWTAHNGSGTQPINTTAGLIFADYPSSNIGNAALLDNNGEDVNRSFSPVSSGNLYCSFLVKVDGLLAGGHFLHLGPSTIGTNYKGRVYANDVSGNVQFGLSFGNGTTTYATSNYNFGTTYLIVLKYSIVSGTNNDAVSMYIFANGDNFSNEPSLPTVGPILDAAQSDINPGSIALRQFDADQNIIVDGIRIATGWSQAPLPVELTSFSATSIGSTVNLNWNTATEVNNYGFEVERKAGSLQSTVGGYEKIGFVNGNGNSNSPKSYFYKDKNVSAGKYSYRLKQIDNDGQFEYSKEIEVDLGAPKKFVLSQNYPNPFNPITTIRFNLPEAGNVKLTLFNILGQELKTLVNDFKESGVHTINFDASDLDSGMYIYKLESGSFAQTRKMTLVK